MIAYDYSHQRVAESTSYCLRGTMADGTYTRRRSIAMNSLPLGTRIRLVGRPFHNGLRIFVVRDRIGWGTELDFWSPSCASARIWGRRSVHFRVLPRRPRSGRDAR